MLSHCCQFYICVQTDRLHACEPLFNICRSNLKHLGVSSAQSSAHRFLRISLMCCSFPWQFFPSFEVKLLAHPCWDELRMRICTRTLRNFNGSTPGPEDLCLVLRLLSFEAVNSVAFCFCTNSSCMQKCTTVCEQTDGLGDQSDIVKLRTKLDHDSSVPFLQRGRQERRRGGSGLKSK